MKRFLALFVLVLAFAILPTVTTSAYSPNYQAVQRVPSWNPVGSYVINFNCVTCVPHNITISSYSPYSGAFSGYGTYAVDPSFTWTVSGMLIGSQVTMRILYTGQGAGYYVDLVGTISPNGSMSGSASDSSGGSFGWVTTSGRVTPSCDGRDDSREHHDDRRNTPRSDFGKHISSNRR